MNTPLSEGDLARVLGRLADSVPGQAAPLVPLLAAAHRARRRRRGLVAGTASAVGIVLVAAVLTWGTRGDGRVTPVATVPQPTAGHVFVGMSDIVVEVPTSWVRFQPECGYLASPYVSFLPLTPHGCVPEPDPRPDRSPSLGIGAPSTWGVTAGTSQARVSSQGVSFEFARTCGGDVGGARCQEVVQTADPAVGFVVHFADVPEQVAVADAIVDSLRRLPDGWTTVPYLDQYRGGRTGEEAVRTIEGADLEIEGPTPSARVARTEPLAGTVVAAGSSVRLLDEQTAARWPDCKVTLMADGVHQVLGLTGPVAAVRLAGSGRVDVVVGASCPPDLGVATAVVAGKDSRYGERTTGSLDVRAGDTHVALIFQPCAASAPGCRGPEERRLFPITFEPRSGATP